MKDIIEAFAPSGCENYMTELLSLKLRGKFESLSCDNMGNLVAGAENGGLCIECGMDTKGVMVVSKDAEKAFFSAVGKVRPVDIADKTVFFVNGEKGIVKYDENTDLKKAKLSDLYIEMDTNGINIGDFGAVVMEFTEEEGSYVGFGLKDRIGLAVVCKMLEQYDEISDLTVLFSAQKRLGGRGIRGFFGANTFEKIITVDGCSDDGCIIVAMDERTVAERKLREQMESIAEECNIFAETAVSEDNFCLEQISISCGDPCGAIGISVLCEEGEPDRVNKSDFDSAVKLLDEIIKRGV